MNKQKNRKNGLLLLTGAIVGAAATYYLNTPKGKQLTQDVINRGREAGESIVTKTSELKDTLKERTNDLVVSAGDSLDSLKDKMTYKSERILSEAEDQLDDLAVGANIAKNAIRNGSLS